MKKKTVVLIAFIIALVVIIYKHQYNKNVDPISKQSFAEGELFPDPIDGSISYEDINGKLMPVAKFNGKTRQYEPLDLVIFDPQKNYIDQKLIKKAKEGHAEAQWMLGTEYYNGEKVRRDYEEAVKWWEKAASQGYAWAQYNLSECYLQGKGIALDRRKGVEYLRLIIEKSDNAYLRAAAMFRLSHCYMQGMGVPKSFNEGTKWLRESSEMGFFPAQKELGEAYLNGFFKLPKDEEQGRLWLKRSEESKQAMANAIYRETQSK